MADIIILTKQEAISFKNGALSKSTFKKLIFTEDFENYLFLYCQIVKDIRKETTRITTFLKFNFLVTIYLELGQVQKVDYTIKL